MLLPEGGTVQVVGRTGSGKTIYAVRSMLALLTSGVVCYSNVKLNWPKVLAYAKKRGVKSIPKGNYRYVAEGDIANFHRILVPGSAIFIDEAQLLYNARDYRATDTTQREMLSFLTQARHQKCTIVFLTQHEANVDTQVARIAVNIIRLKNLLHHPTAYFFWKLFGKPKCLEWSFAATCEKDGKTVVDKDRFVRTAEICEAYDTTQMHASFSLQGEPAEAVEGTAVQSRPGVYLMVLGLILFVAGWFMRPSSPPPAASPQQPVALAPQPLPVSPARPDPVPEEERPLVKAKPKRQSFSAAMEEAPDNWATEEESLALPRFTRFFETGVYLLNESHPIRPGEIWKSFRLVSCYRECEQSGVLVLAKAADPRSLWYVRLYNYRNVRPSRPRGMDSDGVIPPQLREYMYPPGNGMDVSGKLASVGGPAPQ